MRVHILQVEAHIRLNFKYHLQSNFVIFGQVYVGALYVNLTVIQLVAGSNF